jgi:hypothetical protein
MTDAYIVNRGNNRRYNLSIISDFSYTHSQQTMDFPLPEAKAEENLLFRFDGQVLEIVFTFAIIDDGTDKSHGTHTSEVVTITEQLEYLKDYIFTPEYNTYWTLTDNEEFSGGVDGAIKEKRIHKFPGQPDYKEGKITFILGEVV